MHIIEVPMTSDGFVKKPDAALLFILRHCGVRKSTPHSAGFARLACGLFTKPSHFHDFLRLFAGSLYHTFIKDMAKKSHP
jgi:hypothetical protein